MAGSWRVASVVVAVAFVVYYLTWEQFDAEAIRGKRVLITGASSGIGEQLAYEYAKLGARLVLTARRDALLEQVATECKRLGAPQVEVVRGDMSAAGDRSMVVQRTEVLLGGLDHLLLNHANVRYGWWAGRPQDLTLFEEDMALTVFAYVDLASRCLPMLTESGGHLGVVSSLAGKMGLVGMSHNSATKFALQGFFSSWRQELNARGAGVSVTLCVIGLVSSDKAAAIVKGYNQDFNFGLFSTTPQDTAAAILRGVAARSYEVVHAPVLVRLGYFLQRLFPDLVEWTLANAMVYLLDLP